MHFTDTELRTLNRQGLIPGPEESSDDFRKRVEKCLKKGISPDSALLQACGNTQILFDVRPTWVPLTYSDSGLAPWHGACAWIYATPLHATLQVRKRWKEKEKSWGYSREELLSHELCHVGRMAFEEPQFEEVLAYRTSSPGYRRWAGPMVQSSGEAMGFLALVMFLLLLEGYILYLFLV